MISLVCGLCFFFFFQAEDGIRDLTVTGVQTCALPISHHAGAHQDRDHTRARPHPVESGPASRALSARDRARALEAVPGGGPARRRRGFCAWWGARRGGARPAEPDRKSTRLNSSHSQISYAV